MNSFAISCFVLFLLLNSASRVAESRAVAAGDVSSQRRHRHHGHHHDIDSPPTDDDGDTDSPPSDDDDDTDSPPADAKPKKLLVFGDDFADTGNGDSDPQLGYGSRSWRSPFGMSDTAHGRQPSGRFSDGLVQPDFLAKIMGRSESPPPYTYDDWDDGIDAAGLNFAVGGSVALDTPAGVPKLRAQVQQLRNLIRDGVVERKDLRDSVALLAYSGDDYAYANNDAMNDTISKVIDELASIVSDLQDLGVPKVLVNTVITYGCTPWLTRQSSDPYSSCDDSRNWVSDVHNTALRDRLGGEEDVMLLDVNSVVRDLVEPKEGSTLYGKQFKERLRPCCEADDEDAGDYCGLDGRYSLCEHPEEYFFWDNEHPTQAGWRAVMQLLQGPIMAFLGVSNLEHF
ncbi:hypothetical protein SETIT_2G002100v2 [Setaria italica]|uniref:SGNH hydrolase-type esterase domain-containing protein n=1 Tax=Setaria italica TaxID=4555 RepID=K4A0L6_SETIT|nr:GDSL esterase/lipase At5g03600-like [Setaria italica]RCV09135.1 hypothetical protein SETIT_2G002100v2 [Setaria italica]